MKMNYNVLDLRSIKDVKKNREEVNEYYKVVELIDALVNAILDNDKLLEYSTDRDKYIIATLLDCYSTFCSEIILLERGLPSNFNILLRAFYEKKFKFYATIKDEKNYDLIIEEREIFKLRKLKAIAKNENNSFDEIKDKIGITDTNFDIPKSLHIKEWAKKAGLINEYEVQYALLSTDVHYNVMSLENNFVTVKGERAYTQYNFTDFIINLYKACIEMLTIVRVFLCYKDNDEFKDKIDIIKKKLEELGVNIENQNQDHNDIAIAAMGYEDIDEMGEAEAMEYIAENFNE